MIVIFIVIGAVIFICIICGSAFYVKKYLAKLDAQH